MQSTMDSGWEFAGQITAVPQSSHELFTFTDRFCRLVQTSSLDNEKIKNLYRIGVNFVDPRELPDLTGLDWGETIYQRLESFVPPSAFLPVQASLPKLAATSASSCKMAAASVSRREMAATPEPRRKMAASPKALHKMAASPKAFAKMAASPESLFKMAPVYLSTARERAYREGGVLSLSPSVSSSPDSISQHPSGSSPALTRQSPAPESHHLC